MFLRSTVFIVKFGHILTTFSTPSTFEFEQVNVYWGYPLIQYRHVFRKNREHWHKWNNICIFDPDNLLATT